MESTGPLPSTTIPRSQYKEAGYKYCIQDIPKVNKFIFVYTSPLHPPLQLLQRLDLLRTEKILDTKQPNQIPRNASQFSMQTIGQRSLPASSNSPVYSSRC
jgi:hypothetical protein